MAKLLKSLNKSFNKSFNKALCNIRAPGYGSADSVSVLVLGFYDRANIGDEAYKNAFRMLFSTNVVFACIDDIKEVPASVHTIILGGGDVMNAYFVNKLQALTKTFKGPVYAFSVGIPFENNASFTKDFDHVVLRSKQDLETVENLIGAKNVNYIPDLTWILKQKCIVTKPIYPSKIIKFGICLAQPCFYANSRKEHLLEQFLKLMSTMRSSYKGSEFHLIPFNTSVNDAESDILILDKLYERTANMGGVFNYTKANWIKQPLEVIKFIGKMHLVLGMRFHSIVFSMIQRTPFVAIYTTRKIENILKDTELSQYGYKLTLDEHYRPIDLNVESVMQIVAKRLRLPMEDIACDADNFSLIPQLVSMSKRKQLLIKAHYDTGLEEVLEKCQDMVKMYLGIDDAVYNKWLRKEVKTTDLLAKAGKESTGFARLLCFGITRKIGTPYIWGLNTNMQKDDFDPKEAIKWIFFDYVARVKEVEKEHIYYPVVNVRKDITIDMNFMAQDNYEGLHRSGWSFVLGGLQHLDTRNVDKPADILVDTCVERTFLWGLEVLKMSNQVPYKTAWCGFIHHTFNKSYSKYNCETLIGTKEFQESLSTCKCLFVLSKYLRDQLVTILRLKGFTVPVIALVHPTEFVKNNFDIVKFLQNKERKVVQIGAWLRNPYAIYELPLFSNPLGIRKAALKGKEMDNYFSPLWLFPKMFDILKEYNLIHDDHDFHVSRCENEPPEILCRPPIINKYLEGMLDTLYRNDKSVEILEYVLNEEYDELLSQNIVFLNLVDASAVNTAVECLVRNTPLIINRHPAIQELLGVGYPGFYDNLFEAADLVLDLNKIDAIHEYLKALDKSHVTLAAFLTQFQAAVLSVM
jgi:polysaccharide pyruvyl transferase WcaK-like protein